MLGIEGGNFASVDCSVDIASFGKRFIRPAIYSLENLSGEKEIEFIFSNTLHNALGPHYITNYHKEDWINPWTFNAKFLFSEEKIEHFDIGEIFAIKYKK